MHKKLLNRIGKRLDYMKKAGYINGWDGYRGIELKLTDIDKDSKYGYMRAKALQRTLHSKKIKISGDKYIAVGNKEVKVV